VDGRQFVYLNAFCIWATDVDEQWQCIPVVVKDGGACFFRLSSDPSTNSVIRITMNGEA
jgi:hypothetical protein